MTSRRLILTIEMTMRQVSVSASALRRWYVDDRLTMEQIAERMGCGATTVARRLRGASIAVRRRGPAARNGSNRRRIPSLAEPWLPELAWAVGLIATDGNLSRDGRHLTVVSADRDLLASLKSCQSDRREIQPRASLLSAAVERSNPVRRARPYRPSPCEESHARTAGDPRRVLRGLFPRLHRW